MGQRVLFLLSGSIAAYKACEVISKLVQAGHEVRTVATAGALKFVGTATLEGLTRVPPFTDIFSSGRAMDHIELSKWADQAIVCPATASALSRMANGEASDALSSIFLTYPLKDKPWWIAPAMNAAMWSHPAVRANVERLQGYGARFLMPEIGRQACGDTGEGRLMEPHRILEAILHGGSP